VQVGFSSSIFTVQDHILDHSKITYTVLLVLYAKPFKRLQTKSKMVVRISQLLIILTGTIAHNHGNEILFNTPMNFSQMTLISLLDSLKIV
jgi:hypothetical protein